MIYEEKKGKTAKSKSPTPVNRHNKNREAVERNLDPRHVEMANLNHGHNQLGQSDTRLTKEGCFVLTLKREILLRIQTRQ